MHIVLARYCYHKSSVRPSVPPSVCDVDVYWAYALSIGAKINDLEWPWRAITHCLSKHVRLSEPTTKIWMKIDPYYNDEDVAQWL